MASTQQTPKPKRRDTLHFPPASAALLEPYLPPSSSTSTSTTSSTLPYTTLTFATSLDSALALAPGQQTALSGPASKAMTHHLRRHHDAILVGAGTARVDDPSLNCRIRRAGDEGPLAGQPRPVVVDPRGRWDFVGAGGGRLARVLRLAREGRGRAPWVVVAAGARVDGRKRAVLEACGGRILEAPAGARAGAEAEAEAEAETEAEAEADNESASPTIAWSAILALLAREGIRSLMIEGGARVINALLSPPNLHLLSAVIVTVAPTWLGQGSVVVAPPRRVEVGDGGSASRAVPAVRLRDVRWCPLGEDVVLCGRVREEQEGDGGKGGVFDLEA